MTHTEAPISHHLLRANKSRSGRIAVRFKRHRDWLELTWAEYFERIEAAGLGLSALGLARGDRVAILSATRLEWAIADLAILGLGAVTVPVYPNCTADELEFVLNHARPRVLIVETAAHFEKWRTIARRCPSVEDVICIDRGAEATEDTLDWDDLLNCGLGVRNDRPDAFTESIAQTTIDEVATIVYTSGTTGRPKGVVLTHRQIMSETQDLMRAFPISSADATLSFLPYAHVLGRIESWLHIYVGFTLSFAEGMDRLRQNLVEARPTVIIGVPRVFEKINEALQARVDADPWRRRLFKVLSEPGFRPREILADRLIYRRLRDALGGRLRFVVSGGAPLDARLAEFFHRAGILILEGYGLTETTGAICVNTPTAFEFGTVGRPLADVEVRLSEDGEISFKSAKLFREYLDDAESTRQAFSDGFFRTGDVGEFTERGFLKITDRKKDLIKTAGGKYVAPQKLEALIKREPLVSNVLIHGDRRKFIVALITLNETRVLALAREKGWSYRDYRALTQMAQVRATIKHAVETANAELSPFETIKDFAILAQDFTLERGELTPSLKVKRRALDEAYRATIDALYAGPNPSRPSPVGRP